MSIEKMLLVNIAGQMKNLDRTIEKCVESGCFHIESASGMIDQEDSGFTVLNEENPYRETLNKLVSVDFKGEFSFSCTDISDIVSEPISKITEYVDEISDKMNVLNSEINEVKNQLGQYKQVLTQLEHLQGMDIDIKSLFQCKHIHVRFGKIPVDSYPKLEYYGDDIFTFVHYDVDKDYYWGMYFAPVANLKKADKIFSDLYFERIWLPDYITEKPEEAIENIKEKYSQTEQKFAKLEKCRENLISVEKDKLNKSFCRLRFLYDCFEFRGKAAVLKEKFCIVGFVAESDAEYFSSIFEGLSGVSVVLKPPDSDGKIKIPVKLKMNRFTKPFSMFVEMYGLPEYGGFNPVGLVAITYTILFGIMFGDLGQGLVLAIGGALLYKKTGNSLCAIISRIGISSSFFGLIFGSVFGFEHALDPLYKAIGFEEKPFEVMDNVSTILGAAIAIGVVLIIISMFINIIASLKRKEYDAAVFGNNGITGLIFFCAIIYAAVPFVISGENVLNPVYVIFLIVLPLLIMMFREPLGCKLSGKKYKSEGIGDFIASNFFEVFEFCLGYVTNTLSFVRIGGFVLSHAAMMSVVMLLSEMYESASPVIIILGNIFVIGMEGMLSGIQVLRLEFYEIFSRCYDGDGKAFEPIKIRYTTEIE